MTMIPLGRNKNEFRFQNGINILYSYSTRVAAFIPDIGYVQTETFYSTTTKKHINSWIPENTISSFVSQEYLDSLS